MPASLLLASLSYVDDSQQVHLMADLQRIATCCCAHSLLINPDKTKFLLLGTPHMLSRVPEGFFALAWQRDIAIPFCQESGGCYGFTSKFRRKCD